MKLVSMYGNPRVGAPQYQFSLFSMAGNEYDEILSIDPRDLTPVDAGIQTLYAYAKAKPGATWRDLINFSKQLTLGKKWYERFGAMVGNGLSDAGNKIGEWTGSGVRLLTDKEVMEGVSQYGAAYATGGSSMGIQGMLQNLGAGSGLSPDMLQGLLRNLGLSTQKNVQAAGIGAGQWDPKILMLAGGALVLVLLLLK